LVHELHPDTVDRRDYSSFRLKAWCSKPELIPAVMDLDIVEPPVHDEDLKRALSYEIKVAVSVAPLSGVNGVPPAPPPQDDPGHGRRRRRRYEPDPPESSAPDSGASIDGATRVPVHRRLGPVCVEPVDGSLRSVPEATQVLSILSPASFLPAVIDDMAALVIMPRFGEEEVIPGLPGF